MITKKYVQLSYGELFYLNDSWPETINCKNDIEHKRWGILETIRQKLFTIFIEAKKNYTGPSNIAVMFLDYQVIELKWYLQEYKASSLCKDKDVAEQILSKISS